MEKLEVRRIILELNMALIGDLRLVDLCLYIYMLLYVSQTSYTLVVSRQLCSSRYSRSAPQVRLVNLALYQAVRSCNQLYFCTYVCWKILPFLPVNFASMRWGTVKSLCLKILGNYFWNFTLIEHITSYTTCFPYFSPFIILLLVICCKDILS